MCSTGPSFPSSCKTYPSRCRRHRRRRTKKTNHFYTQSTLVPINRHLIHVHNSIISTFHPPSALASSQTSIDSSFLAHKQSEAWVKNLKRRRRQRKSQRLPQTSKRNSFWLKSPNQWPMTSLRKRQAHLPPKCGIFASTKHSRTQPDRRRFACIMNYSLLNPHIPSPPLAASQVLKLAKKAAKRKQIKRGVKEVIKAIRKKTKGYVPLHQYTHHSTITHPSHFTTHFTYHRVCIIAGDISPIDVITPLPVLCEDNDIPYVYVPSKDELGQAGLTKRPTSCMLILPKPLKGEVSDDSDAKEYKELYKDVAEKVKATQIVF